MDVCSCNAQRLMTFNVATSIAPNFPLLSKLAGQGLRGSTLDVNHCPEWDKIWWSSAAENLVVSITSKLVVEDMVPMTIATRSAPPVVSCRDTSALRAYKSRLH